ncbi:MAG: hypothetical protein OXE86_13440 [Alphaproteobacteria bacterium]|nr:hypothetical protein [Alphaproteobacteria bacterium]
MAIWEPPPPDQPRTGWQRRWPLLTLLSGVGVVLLGAAITWTWYRDVVDHPPDRADRAALQLPLPERPSVVVLPVAPASTRSSDVIDARQLTTVLTATLARNPGLFVIAPETAGRLRGGQFRIKVTAEALGVANLVTTTLTRSKTGMRAHVQIIDAFTGEADWARTVVLGQAGLHELPQELANELVSELDGDEDARSPPGPGNHAAWVALAEATWYRVPDDRESMATSLEQLAGAEAADPGWSAIPVEAARIWYEAARRDWTGFGGIADRAGLVNAGLEAVDRAVTRDPSDPAAAVVRADLLELAGRDADVLEWRTRAARHGPNSFRAQFDLANTMAKLERHAEAEAALARALRLHPRHPVAMDLRLAELRLLAGQPGQARADLDRVLATRPADPEPNLMLVLALVELGDNDAIRTRIDTLLRLYPDFSLATWIDQRRRRGLDDRSSWRPALLKAGVPD